MKTEIKSFRIIKKMYKYFVEKYRNLEAKLMICEKEDFDNVEKTLKWVKEIDEVLKDYNFTRDDIINAIGLYRYYKDNAYKLKWFDKKENKNEKEN